MSEIMIWRPSSGTIGQIFIANWCGTCERDKCANGTKTWDECNDDELCPIVGRTMCLELDDPGYPTEWRLNEQGNPICTAHVPIGEPLPPVRDDRTMDMFEVTA